MFFAWSQFFLEEINKTSHVPNSFSIMLAGSFGKAHRSNNLCRGQHPAASPGWALSEAGRESFCLAVAALRVIVIAVHEDLCRKGRVPSPVTTTLADGRAPNQHHLPAEPTLQGLAINQNVCSRSYWCYWYSSLTLKPSSEIESAMVFNRILKHQ